MANQNNETTFANVGGLSDQIKTVRELILFPLQHKQLCQSLNMRVARGCIFHGPPGTGKTLLASALAQECATVDGRKVTFISRKGTDILNCYVGESEKNLRLVFARARLFAPALIFFDEIDALAPARSSLGRTCPVYSSLVSVLLTEMDGVGSAGDDVFVIGATNRLETVDPALRRPGRFDSELRFELPNEAERRAIIRVHVARWRPTVTDATVARLAALTHGHCGADLAAMCTTALMEGIRRAPPPPGSTRVAVSAADFELARRKLKPASRRAHCPHARAMPAVVEPLFRGEVDAVVAALWRRHPHAFLRGGDAVEPRAALPALDVPRVLLTGAEDHGHTRYLAPAVLRRLEHLPVVALDYAAVFGASGSPDAACAELLRRAAASTPCVLYAPDIAGWWRLVGEATRSMFAQFVESLEASAELLVVATAHESYDGLPHELRRLFVGGGDVHRVRAPRDELRRAFFAQLILDVDDDDDDDDDVATGSDDSGDESSGSEAPSSSAKKSGAAYKGVRGGRVEKAPKRTSRTSAPAAPAPSYGPRGDLLARLVAGTCGLASFPLERAYGALLDCARRWREHGEERLLAELGRCVAAIERDAKEYASRQEEQPDYLL